MDEPEESSTQHPSSSFDHSRWRLFIALPLPHVHKAGLAELLEHLRKGCQFTRCRPAWVNADNIHLTIAFFGNRPPGDAEVIQHCLVQAAKDLRPLRLEIKGLGVFPDWRRPRVLWAGLRERTHQLEPLRKRLAGELQAKMIPFDDKPFKPHLTLARFKSLTGMAEFAGVAAAHQGFRLPAMPLDKLTLYRSELDSAGARHIELHSEIFKEHPIDEPGQREAS